MPGGSVLVIGGGIGGLSLAFHLHLRGVPVELIDAGSSPGGVIQTYAADGWLFEFGPNTVAASDPAVAGLVTAAGLDDERLLAAAAGARRWIVRRGRLEQLPTSPGAFLGSRLFGFGARLRMLTEPFRGRGPVAVDESVADFTRRRLGREILDYAVGPFVSGVHAGDAERLSVRHAFPRLAALEAKHGSLIRGAIAGRRGARSGPIATAAGALLSFREGLARLPARLVEILGSRVTLGASVERLTRVDAGWRVEASTAGGQHRSWSADRVVLTVDGRTTARWLPAPDLAGIPMAGVAVTAFGFRRDDVGHALDGFGFLVPRREGRRLLGTLFASSLFPGRAPEGHVALTAIAGGATDPSILDLDDEALKSLLLSELAPLLEIRGGPVLARTVRWPHALAQYNVGHQRYLDLATELEARHQGLYLAGSWRGGLSVPDRIRTGRDLAERLAAE